jgi:hypothetical protein
MGKILDDPINKTIKNKYETISIKRNGTQIRFHKR